MWKSLQNLEASPENNEDNYVDNLCLIIHISTFARTLTVIHNFTNKLYTVLSTSCG